MNKLSSPLRVLLQWNNDCTGCKGGVCPQSNTRPADSEGQVLQTSLQRRSSCIFLFQRRLLWNHQNSKFYCLIKTMPLFNVLIKVSSFSSLTTTCCMKMRSVYITTPKDCPTRHLLILITGMNVLPPDAPYIFEHSVFCY